jgi:hypothetical protein
MSLVFIPSYSDKGEIDSYLNASHIGEIHVGGDSKGYAVMAFLGEPSYDPYEPKSSYFISESYSEKAQALERMHSIIQSIHHR